jgi:heat shock protein HtpX
MGNVLKTGILLGVLTALFVLIGGAVGGQNGMVIAFVLALGMNAFSYWFSDKIVLRMYRAQPISESQAPALYATVRRLATRAQIPMPPIYLIPTDAPNAFATGRDSSHAAVAVTEGILRILNEEELEGVLAHELSHVRNRDVLISTIAATLAGAITYLAHMLQWGALLGGRQDDEGRGHPMAGLVLAIVAPLAAMLIQLAVSRSREFHADATGARLAGRPDGLASALRKLEIASRTVHLPASPATAHLFIVNPLSGEAFQRLFSTHPSTAERIARLNAIR